MEGISSPANGLNVALGGNNDVCFLPRSVQGVVAFLSQDHIDLQYFDGLQYEAILRAAASPS